MGVRGVRDGCEGGIKRVCMMRVRCRDTVCAGRQAGRQGTDRQRIPSNLPWPVVVVETLVHLVIAPSCRAVIGTLLHSRMSHIVHRFTPILLVR
jgi:hypothetical protein